MIACDFERDVYYDVPHPTLAWSVIRVSVREVGRHWEQAHEFQLAITGMGTPFMVSYLSRDAAGRNGMFCRRHALMRVPDADRQEAQKHAETLWEILNPSQLTLSL